MAVLTRPHSPTNLSFLGRDVAPTRTVQVHTETVSEIVHTLVAHSPKAFSRTYRLANGLPSFSHSPTSDQVQRELQYHIVSHILIIRAIPGASLTRPSAPTVSIESP